MESPDRHSTRHCTLFTWWKVETYSGRNSPAAERYPRWILFIKVHFRRIVGAYNSDQHIQAPQTRKRIVHSGVAIARVRRWCHRGRGKGGKGGGRGCAEG